MLEEIGRGLVDEEIGMLWWGLGLAVHTKIVGERPEASGSKWMRRDAENGVDCVGEWSFFNGGYWHESECISMGVSAGVSAGIGSFYDCTLLHRDWRVDIGV